MSESPDQRAFERRAIAVGVSAWSLVQSTERLSGTTVDLSGGGALLELPGLSDAAVRLELRLALPREPFVVVGNIVWRRPPDFVAVAFDDVQESELARLLDFLDST